LLAISPSSVAGWNNLGNTLLEMRRYEAAAESYSHALRLAPGLHDSRVALATCYQALGLTEEAMAACNTVLEYVPDHAEAHWNKALLLLLAGDYKNGWREYEWRWRKRNFTSPRREFHQPRWQGNPLTGRTILVHSEQGFGDTIQFCRYVPLVAARGARVIFECHPPLVSLMKTLAGDVSVIPMGEQAPSFDMQEPLMSLPMIFGTSIETIPAAVPYLAPPIERLPFWRNLMPDKGLFKVGLCWAGKSYPDPGRSCPPDQLSPLAELGGISFHSLQVGWEKDLPLPMTDLTKYLNDFADTACLVALLDMVITIDTAVAHLAGAMGKPTWLMLPHAPDWRWMTKRHDSPWYPSVRIFRQADPGSWEEVVREVASSLYKEVQTTHRSRPAEAPAMYRFA
jgi:hypothetical protein